MYYTHKNGSITNNIHKGITCILIAYLFIDINGKLIIK